MRAEALAGVVGIAGLMLGMLGGLPAAPAVKLDGPAVSVPAPSFPPAPGPRTLARAERAGAPAVMSPDAEIARLGRAAPRPDPQRRAFLEANSLVAFALERLPAAAEGDAASQYFLYLALDQCRNYLRADADAANANFERMLRLAELSADERIAWHAEYERCRGFAMQDWSAVGEALGDERPGAEVEYASVWFERAALSGHPAALAEQALRLGPIDAAQRRAMLRDGLAGGGADVYWLLFAHSGEVQTGEANASALAWLIVACRAGHDCGEQARWYRGFVCSQDERRCRPGQSALEYYWAAAAPLERTQAWAQAAEIEGNMANGAWDRLPLPDLESRDSQHLWADPGT